MKYDHTVFKILVFTLRVYVEHFLQTFSLICFGVIFFSKQLNVLEDSQFHPRKCHHLSPENNKTSLSSFFLLFLFKRFQHYHVATH